MPAEAVPFPEGRLQYSESRPAKEWVLSTWRVRFHSLDWQWHHRSRDRCQAEIGNSRCQDGLDWLKASAVLHAEADGAGQSLSATPLLFVFGSNLVSRRVRFTTLDETGKFVVAVLEFIAKPSQKSQFCWKLEGNVNLFHQVDRQDLFETDVSDFAKRLADQGQICWRKLILLAFFFWKIICVNCGWCWVPTTHRMFYRPGHVAGN